MCGLCGFGLDDARLVLDADLSRHDGARIERQPAPAEKVADASRATRASEASVAAAIAEVWQNHFGAFARQRRARAS